MFKSSSVRVLLLSSLLFAGDGLAQTCAVAVDLSPLNNVPSKAREIISLDGTRVLFWADDGITGWGLWVWDQVNGATLLMNTDSTLPQMSHLYTAYIGGRQRAVFRAYTTADGNELWSTDGTVAGTHLVKDILSGPDFSSNISEFYGLGGHVYFYAGQFESSVSAWRTDGIVGGVQEITTGGVGPWGGDGSMLGFQGRLYFSAFKDAAFGYELFSTDGTPSGMTQVKDVNPGNGNSLSRPLFVYQDRLYFSAVDSTNGRELWSTDGTDAGTTLAFDLNPGSGSSNPTILGVVQGQMLLSLDNGVLGAELYRSDGTAAGTHLVKDINPGSADGATSADWPHLIAGDRLYFVANDGVNGYELWISDGSPAGTLLLADIAPGSQNSLPGSFVAANGGVYFSAVGLTGRLWFTDGTSAGTTQVCVTGASDFEAPRDLTLVDGTLLFSANTTLGQRELYALSIPGAYAANIGSSPMGSGGTILTATDPILGGSFSVNADSVPTAGVSILAISAPVSSPSNSLTQPDHALWLDPQTASLVGIFTGTSWTFNTSLPVAPALVGVQVNLQNIMLRGGQFPAATSNALSLVFGS